MYLYIIVAPPRGERGLKSSQEARKALFEFVAPPRGERGLKYPWQQEFLDFRPSLPLAGSVD